MPKFIKTYHGKEVVIKQIKGCEDCPLFKFYPEDKAGVCRQFVGDSNNVIKRFITSYDRESGKIFRKLDIPAWCGLDRNVKVSYFNNEVHRISATNINISKINTPHNIRILDASNNKDLNVDIEAFLWDKKYQKIKEDFRKDQELKIYKREEDNRISWEVWNDNLNSDEIPSKKCSLCGCEEESVKRSTHFGMCEACWELSNDKTKKQAFINNFRLKRNIEFSMTSFKVIEELKI